MMFNLVPHLSDVEKYTSPTESPKKYQLNAFHLLLQRDGEVLTEKKFLKKLLMRKEEKTFQVRKRALPVSSPSTIGATASPPVLVRLLAFACQVRVTVEHDETFRGFVTKPIQKELIVQHGEYPRIPLLHHAGRKAGKETDLTPQEIDNLFFFETGQPLFGTFSQRKQSNRFLETQEEDCCTIEGHAYHLCSFSGISYLHGKRTPSESVEPQGNTLSEKLLEVSKWLSTSSLFGLNYSHDLLENLNQAAKEALSHSI